MNIKNIEWIANQMKKGVELNYSEKNDIKNITTNDPSIYFFYNEDDNMLEYVGETMMPQSRFKKHEHYNSQSVITFSSDYFHKSAIYDIESRMIRLLKSYEKTMNINISNKKILQTDMNYFTKELYEDVDKKIWEKLLERKIVDKPYEFVKTSQKYKWSPYTIPNQEQLLMANDISDSILNNVHGIDSVVGDPGTGKSLVLIKIAKILSDKNVEVIFVTANERARDSFSEVFVNHKNVSVIPVDRLHSNYIGNDNVGRVLIIDEAQSTHQHKLIQTISRSRRWNRRKTTFINKHLPTPDDSTISKALESFNNVVMGYDLKQTVAPDSPDINLILNKSNMTQNIFELKMQNRSNSEWLKLVKSFLYNNNELFVLDNKFDITISDTAIEMVKKIQPMQTTALLSGYAFQWISKKDDLFDFSPVGLNKTKWAPVSVNFQDWIQTDKARNFEEVLYYKTIQGFEVESGGLIIGKDLCVIDGKLSANTDYLKTIWNNSFSKEFPLLSDSSKDGKDDFTERYLPHVTSLILNRYFVLMTRFRKSVSLYFEDKEVEELFKQKFV